ncbi:MAG: hypothetical protein ABI277_17495 [Burkholderiaceae bacterium]
MKENRQRLFQLDHRRPGSIVPTAAQAAIVAGSAVPYESQSFTIGATGTYSFLTTGNYDTFTTLYASAFDPTRPLNNVQAANDARFDPDTSAFIYDLVAGTTYTFVTSGYDNATSASSATPSAAPAPSRWCRNPK